VRQVKILMPRMGTSVHEGTVVQWLKEEGDVLKKGDPLLLAESEKVEFEMESPYNGRLVKILTPVQSAIPVGEIMALVETEDEVLVEEESESGPDPVPAPTDSEASPPPSAPERVEGQAFLSPRVRRLARERGVPLEEAAKISGSGRNGRVTEADLEAYVAQRGPSPATGAGEGGGDIPAPEDADVLPLSPLRRRLSRRLSESVQGIPQFTTFDEADVTDIVERRKAKGELTFARKGIHLTVTHFLAWAAIRALERIEFQPLNARFAGDAIHQFRTIHLGVAVAVPDGLLVPVIRGAETLSFAELARRVTDLADQARQGTLIPEDASGSTFTITNAGAAGSLYATPILNPPEAAILGVGAIRKRVVPLEDGSIGIRDRMGVSLTVDHRVVDGMLAAQFNRVVCQNLEQFDFSVLD